MKVAQVAKLVGTDMVQGVKLYAQYHYADGWDFIAHWTDDDIREVVGPATELWIALRKFSKYLTARKESGLTQNDLIGA